MSNGLVAKTLNIMCHNNIIITSCVIFILSLENKYKLYTFTDIREVGVPAMA